MFADGVLLLSPPADPAHVADLRIFNPDGSEAELSGNGAREAILYLRRRGWTDQDAFSIHTAAGEIRPTITGPDTCTVDMGRASLSSKDFPGGPPDGRGRGDARAGASGAFQHVSIGNPQCAIHVGRPARARRRSTWPRSGRRSKATRSSQTARTCPGTPSSSRPEARDRIRARIFERGVGETLSSGTGATGAAVAYVRNASCDAAAERA